MVCSLGLVAAAFSRTLPAQSVTSSVQASSAPSPHAASPKPSGPTVLATVTVDDARKIAEQAYIFAYPLVVTEMTRRATTGGGDARFMNRFRHEAAFPDDRFREVIRPNADTLYSAAWFDLSREPVLLHVPDTKGRYYIMQIMDAWSETIASPGKRTTGTGEAWFAVAGPGWKGKLPGNVRRIDSPTSIAWLIGRTQANGPKDFDYVHTIQQGYKLAPLSTYPDGLPSLPAPDAGQLAAGGNVPPPVRVAQMSPAEFFRLFAELLQSNPAHAADGPMMSQLAQIGIVPGGNFPSSQLAPEQLLAIDEGARAGAASVKNFDRSKLPGGKTAWTLPGHYGRYGTSYMMRALVAAYFLGALPAEDAVYLSCDHDSAGQPLKGARRYTMHFDKGQVPAVKAFWSLTLYDADGYFAANPIKRFAIGDRDPLKYNADGSLDLYIQHDSPGSDKESNWLPAPAASFNLALRMFWPGEKVVSGEWIPPAVVGVDSSAAH
jgi:hypothetical protein